MKPGNHRWRTVLGLALLLALPLCSSFFKPLQAQPRRDPLDPLEIDQLRDAMLDPDTRLKLYVKFSRDRMTKLEQRRSDPKTKERGRQPHSPARGGGPHSHLRFARRPPGSRTALDFPHSASQTLSQAG